jgi:hypothetical protein
MSIRNDASKLYFLDFRDGRPMTEACLPGKGRTETCFNLILPINANTNSNKAET